MGVVSGRAQERASGAHLDISGGQGQEVHDVLIGLHHLPCPHHDTLVKTHSLRQRLGKRVARVPSRSRESSSDSSSEKYKNTSAYHSGRSVSLSLSIIHGPGSLLLCAFPLLLWLMTRCAPQAGFPLLSGHIRQLSGTPSQPEPPPPLDMKQSLVWCTRLFSTGSQMLVANLGRG